MFQYADELTPENIREGDEFAMVRRDDYEHYWPYDKRDLAKFVRFTNATSVVSSVRGLGDHFEEVNLSWNARVYGHSLTWAIKIRIKDYRADQVADEAEDLL